MSFVIERAFSIEDNHHALIVRPDMPPVRELPPHEWPNLARDAVAVVGILARVALDIEYPLRIQRREHRCVTTVRRYDDDLGELVEGTAYDGCRASVSAAFDDEPHLIQNGTMPRLVLHIPRNRERAWRERLTAALDRVNAENVATMTRPPPIDDGPTASNEPRNDEHR